MIRLAIFASGNGTNMQRLAEYFRDHTEVSIVVVLSNNPDAFVLERARLAGIPAHHFNRADLYKNDTVEMLLRQHQADYLILAGFLWLVPEKLLQSFSGRILNIHPALLPKYGGKGMYGHHVHEAVIAARDTESGITIHEVNQNYDEGRILFQAACPVLPGDTPECLAERIHQLEYEHFPVITERFVMGLL